MRLLTTRHGRNFLTVVATLVCVAVVHLSSDIAIRSIAGLPLILFLPGTALVSAADPFGHQVWGVPRLLWSVGASIGSMILGGLLLNVTSGLTATGWLVLVTCDVVVLALASSLRVIFSGSKYAAASSTASERTNLLDIDDDPDVAEERVPAIAWALPRVAVSLRQWTLIAVAIAIAIGTVALSQHSVAVASKERFVQGWIIPQPVNDPWSSSAVVGVRNLTGATETVLINAVLSPRKGGAPTTLTWTEDLTQGASSTHLISREPGEPVQVTVALAQAPTVIVSTVNLVNPAT